MVLKRALAERWTRWGRDFVDPKTFKEPVGRNGQPLGVRVYMGFVAEFDLQRLNGETHKTSLVLNVDAKAKVEQTTTVHDVLADINRSRRWSPKEQDEAIRVLEGTSVLTNYDKRNFAVYDIDFRECADSLKIPGTSMTHTQYFAEKKKIKLKYPKDPLIQTKGRNDMKIYLPPELLHTTELSLDIKAKLPQIAGFPPADRFLALSNFVKFLEPGAQTTKGLKGLLPGIGVRISSLNIPVSVIHMPIPLLHARGISV